MLTETKKVCIKMLYTPVSGTGKVTKNRGFSLSASTKIGLGLSRKKDFKKPGTRTTDKIVQTKKWENEK